MPPPTATFSTAHLKRQRASHAQADGYGRHRHLYLHDTLRALAAALRDALGRPPDWLDYGCGKGGFIEEMRLSGLFGRIAGYDPAVATFAARPSGAFDLVTCLDVLDVVEPAYMDAVLWDVAALTAHVAVFDCLTRPKPGVPLRAHAPFYWAQLVRQHIPVRDTKVEFPGMVGFERAIVVAAPAGSLLNAA